jgi:hypothetical protein
VLTGEDNDHEGLTDKEKRMQHNKEVLARVDSMLAQRSSSNGGADFSFDSSFPESFGLNTTMDSGTAVDTSFDSSAEDTAFSSTLDHPNHKIASGTVDNCTADPADFLNHVFDVPLQAPLEFWCGEMNNCAASTDASMQHKKKMLQQRKMKLNNPYDRKESHSSADDASMSVAPSSIHEDEKSCEAESAPHTDESVSLMDPPTHDSRIFAASDDDDSTMATLNTNRQEGEDEEEDDDDYDNTGNIETMNAELSEGKNQGVQSSSSHDDAESRNSSPTHEASAEEVVGILQHASRQVEDAYENDELDQEDEVELNYTELSEEEDDDDPFGLNNNEK